MALAPDPVTMKAIIKTVAQIADPVRKAHAMQLTAKIAKRVVAPQAEKSAQEKARQVEARNPKQEANREAERERQQERAKGRDIELGD